MAQTAARKSVLFICGSLRKCSLNRQYGEMARTALGDKVETKWLEYADLPYMNQDTEFPPPAPVERVRNEVLAADAIWICSPEYNHGIPGVLKNCIDWLSRPVTPGGSDAVLQDKLITYSCCGGGAIARYSAADLAETLTFISKHVILTMHEEVALDRQDYTTDVLTLTESEKIALAAQAQILLSHMK